MRNCLFLTLFVLSLLSLSCGASEPTGTGSINIESTSSAQVSTTSALADLALFPLDISDYRLVDSNAENSISGMQCAPTLCSSDRDCPCSSCDGFICN